jgi:uncharacterized coiled-coil DUF342 family protein
MRSRQSQRKNMSSTVETQAPEVVDQAETTHEKKSPQESFAELRQAKERLERELWQAQKERELEKQMYQQAQTMQKPQQPQEEDFDYRQLEQEEFPDGKKLVKALNSFNKKLSGYEQQLAQKDQKIQILETATEFSDFRDVVTPENIEKYIKSDEDNREAVETAKNPLRKVYNLIKKSAAYQADLASKAVKDKPVSQEQKRVDDKEGKPKTGSLGVRSEAVTVAAKLSNSTMTKEMRNSLWKETLAAARK